jgi:deoxyribonuclease-4
MKIGMHVSIREGLDKSIDNALAMKCTALQIFTRNPRGWTTKPLLKSEIVKFRKRLDTSRIDRMATAAHMPYLPNFSSPEAVPFKNSLKSLIDEAKRCSSLGIPYLVAHLGSHKGLGEEKGIDNVVKAFAKAAKETPSDVTFLLENNIGSKNSVGSEFAKIASIFFQIKPLDRFGICFDTCHAFAAGYDLRTEKTVSSTLEKFDESIGVKHIKLIHLNDSKGPLGCNMDRHEHLGLGHIGDAGLSRVIKFANSKKIPIIMETPIDDRRDDIGNMKKAEELSQ